MIAFGRAARPRRSDTHRRPRRGFALVAVLWIIVSLSALALVFNLAGRASIGTATTRLALERARWRAEGCLEITRDVIADVLGDRASWVITAPTWTTLDRAVHTAPAEVQSQCHVEMRAAGIALDVNAADADAFRTLFRTAGLPPLTSDSLTDAILDWRDSGHVARPLGAKRAWYDSASRFAPRNGPFADVRELRRVRGFTEALARVPALDTLLTTEPGRIVIALAPEPVLATIPGFSDEAVARVLEDRSRGIGPADVMSLISQLSPAARSALTARSINLMSRVTSEPEAWIVTARATSGQSPAVAAWIEVRLVRAGPRAAIVRRRTWP
jgi:type II secretory pathway component PulK